MKKLSKPLKWAIPIVILGSLIGLIYPVFQMARHASLVGEPRAHLHTYASSTLMYSADNDNRLPHASSHPSARAMIAEYGYRGFAWSYHPVKFNLNLAAVNLSSFDQTDSSILFWYLIPTSEEFPTIVVNCALKSEFVTTSELLNRLEVQFDRTGATLAPADYLVDQDPLK